MEDKQRYLQGHKLGIRTKTALFLSSVLVLSNYYYYYLFSFEQGQVIGAPWWLYLIKYIAIFIFFYVTLVVSFKTNFSVPELLLIVFLFSFCTVLLIKSAYWESESRMFFNFLFSSVPLLLLKMELGASKILFFLDSCLLVIVIQVFIEIYIYIYGYSLWDNKAFIGGLGNPSSFGFMCNIFIAYILFFKEKSLVLTVGAGVLTLAVVMTSSLMSLLMTAIVFLFAIIKSRHGWVYGIAIFSLMAASFLFYENILSSHLLYKIESLAALSAPSYVDGEVSRSVSLRYLIHEQFFNELESNFAEVIIFGYSGVAYFIADSQYLTYFGSVGVFSSIIFFLATYLLTIKRYQCINCFGLRIMFLMYLVMFFTNRILDYHPVAFFFFIMIALSSSLKRKESL